MLVSLGLALVLVFFFQAEDGIRDTSVTGVQTCALPISSERAPARQPGAPGWNYCAPNSPRSATVSPTSIGAGRRWRHASGHSLRNTGGRSEERRVGKEGSAREEASDEKNKS